MLLINVGCGRGGCGFEVTLGASSVSVVSFVKIANSPSNGMSVYKLPSVSIKGGVSNDNPISLLESTISAGSAHETSVASGADQGVYSFVGDAKVGDLDDEVLSKVLAGVEVPGQSSGVVEECCSVG